MKMFDSPPMRETLRRTIRAQMAYKAFEYKDLSAALEELGVHQSESNLRSKVNNGALGAQLFVYILMALGVNNLDVTHLTQILNEVNSTETE